MPDLFLIPTEMERQVMLRVPASKRIPETWSIELCGFGLVSAAARASQRIAELGATRVLLLGIAGSLDDSLPLGSAMTFERVVCDGIGVGSGAGHRSAGQLGWHQWTGNETGETIGDSIELSKHHASRGALVSACAASADPAEAVQRRKRFPDALAEEMEGFAVAMVCRLHRVPLTIVRGLSNRAGDRRIDHWCVDAAIASATEIALEIIDGSS